MTLWVSTSLGVFSDSLPFAFAFAFDRGMFTSSIYLRSVLKFVRSTSFCSFGESFLGILLGNVCIRGFEDGFLNPKISLKNTKSERNEARGGFASP